MSKVTLPIEKIDALRNSFGAFNKRAVISAGDIVVLRDDIFSTYKFPTKETPGIVVEVLPTSKFAYEIDGDLLSSPNGTQRADVHIMILDEKGDELVFAMDSRFLQKVGG